MLTRPNWRDVAFIVPFSCSVIRVAGAYGLNYNKDLSYSMACIVYTLHGNPDPNSASTT